MINGTEMTKNSGTFGVVVGWVIDLLVISETETGSLNTWAQEIFPGHVLGDNFLFFWSLLVPPPSNLKIFFPKKEARR